jgi:xanthine dehydrogenase accessory factor
VDVEFEFAASGEVRAAAGGLRRSWQLPWRDLQLPMPEFRVRIPRAPRLLVFGAGPEAALLLPWMRQLGWYVSLVERRTRWTSQLTLADVGQQTMPAAAVSRLAELHHDAAIVMNHDFELDREALESLAETAVPWIGVLGPARRRDDLLRLVGPSRTKALRPRLHAPVGLPLGGRGPESISLSIAAELHAHWNGMQAAAPAAAEALTAAT